MSATYRYVFYDLATDKAYAELPLFDARFEWRLNKAGGWQGTVPLMDRRVRTLNWREAIQETRTWVGMERNRQLIYGGIVWDTDFTDEHDVLPIKGEDILSYFDHRAIHRDYSYTSVEQLDIANDLLVTAQRDTVRPDLVVGGDIGVVSVPYAPSGNLVTRNYLAHEGHYYGTLLTNFTDNVDGFDLRFVTDRHPATGAIRKRLQYGYPFMGEDAATTTFTLVYPGQIRNFAWPVQGSDSATRVIAVSDGGIIAIATANEAISGGLPLVDKITTYTGITGADTLQRHADQDLLKYYTPVSIPPIQVDASIIFDRGLWPGDGITLVVDHPIYFPGRRDSWDGNDYRLISPFRIGSMKLDADQDVMELELINPRTSRVGSGALALPAPAAVEVS